ncbi:VOC family protein [Aeoliella mucimassa]|uniref:Putative lyase n=1 Tax=Aeoliella mucimassa TaxID=2527972 RepID=A0A518ARZ6_9BACT|nr:VOC family protein [Aeoliella mucimassa]QDU57484.1 putative lyase [Aeoliella mucimassa]
MPESIAVSRFNHAAVNASDVAASVAFYTQVLGFYEVPRPSFSFAGSWLYSEGLGMMLHLINDDRFTPIAERENTRRSHLAFRVADIDRTLELLAEHQVPVIQRRLPDHNYRQLFIHDPDGNLLELGEWPDVEQMDLTRIAPR